MITLGQYLSLYNSQSDDNFRHKLGDVFGLKMENDILLKMAEFTAIQPKVIKGNTVKVGKLKFKFNEDFETVTYEQWLYFNDFIDEEKLDTTTNNISYILALFLQPINFWGRSETFNKNKLDELAKYFEDNMDIELALGLAGFFLKLEQTLLKCISAQYMSETQMWVEQQIQR